MRPLLLLACLALAGCGLNEDYMTRKFAGMSNEELIAHDNMLPANHPQKPWLEAEAAKRVTAMKASNSGKLEGLAAKGVIRRSMIPFIQARKARIGMSRQEARLAWGTPEDVNTTLTARGRREQWCYGGFRNGRYREMSFLYFENGTLTTIQN